MANRVRALEMHPLPFCSALLNLYKSIHYFIYTFKYRLCFTKDQYLEAEMFVYVIGMCVDSGIMLLTM